MHIWRDWSRETPGKARWNRIVHLVVEYLATYCGHCRIINVYCSERIESAIQCPGSEAEIVEDVHPFVETTRAKPRYRGN